MLASGSWDGTIHLWDVKRGEKIGQAMEGHIDGVTSVGFSPDGRKLASGSWDMTVHLWDVKKGKQPGQSMEGHKRPVQSVAFSPNGTRVASGSSDHTVWVWDVEKGEQIGQPLQGHTNPITSVVFSSDTNLLSCDSTGQSYCWSLESLGDMPSTAIQSCKDLSPIFSPFALEGQWLTYTGSRIIWLPSQFLDSDDKTISLSASTLLVTGSYVAFLDISDLLQLSPLHSICS